MLAGQPAGVSHGPYQAPARILDDERREIEREYSLVAFARLLAIEIGEPPSLLEELSLAPCGFRAPVTGLPAARAR